MDLQDLRVFISVYEMRNFLRASVALRVAQSSVSWRIRNLEREIDGSLFERLQRGVRPTAKAEVLYRHAQKTLASLEETERAVRETKGAA